MKPNVKDGEIMQAYDDVMSIFLGYFLLFCSILIIGMTINLEFGEFYAILFGIISGLIVLGYGIRHVR
jgi:hypothetical protein